ncbi:MAG: hypothetical protein LUQ38_10850 [Methanotrichaceae archaeon]|nr:hypothetical protein [Methanotrichaceae archaeon]
MVGVEKGIEDSMKSYGCGQPIITVRTIDGKPGAMGILGCPSFTGYLIEYPWTIIPRITA